MCCYFGRLPVNEQWYWLRMRVRLGLLPNEPAVIATLLQQGMYLSLQRPAQAWPLGVAMADCLLAAAADRALPRHWRRWCLQGCEQVLPGLQRVARDDAHQAVIQRIRRQQQRLLLCCQPLDDGDGND